MPLSRFDYERVVTSAPRARCHPSVRHLLLTLLVHLDREAGVILPQYQPSITQLAREMGTDRRTTSRRIRRAMAAGWLTRQSPSKHDARTKHARTHYTLQYPPGYPHARGVSPHGLGAMPPVARGRMPPELGAPLQQARGDLPHESSPHLQSPARDGLGAVVTAIRERTGKAVSEEWAARVVDDITGARGSIRQPIAYAVRVIRGAPADAYVPHDTTPGY